MIGVHIMSQSLVGGRRMERSIASFERACEVYIEAEQEKLAPDNVLIALLCDAVRLSRELEDYATRPPNTRSVDKIIMRRE
jgi:hypothetical protein